MARFTHLSVRSVFSLREGAVRPEELAARAAELGMDAVAITDTNSLAGAVRFAQACGIAGIKPVYGARLTVGPDPSPDVVRRSHPAGAARTTVTLIARDKNGYANLCRLITAAHHNGERGDPCATFGDVAEYSDGLFCLLGPDSDAGTLAANGHHDAARMALKRWLEVFGARRLRIEVRNLLQEGDGLRIQRALRLADELKIKAVATNGVRALVPADAFLPDILDAMRKLVPLAAHHRENRNHEAILKSPQEMAALFRNRPDVVANAWRLAQECEVDLDLGVLHMPPYPLPKGESANAALAKRCWSGLAGRGMSHRQEVIARLQKELSMTTRLGYAQYFLTVADICARIRTMGIRNSCRGSAAGSLICYALHISNVDPIEHDLIFERFMNQHRTHELPDIDIDVESARREDVYKEILGAFSPEQVSCVAMVDTYRARGSIREVAKALGYPEGEVDLVAKAFPHISASGIKGAMERLPELRRSALNAGQLDLLFSIAERLDGFPRHLALHPSGILIGPDDLGARMPMETSANGFRMAQFDKDDVEALGLLKLDILGVRMLSAMMHAVRQVEDTTDEHVDLDAIPREDEKTFELIRASRTLGCFQIESPGQRELLGKFQPLKWADLIIDISLFRPGPVKNDMITPFLNRRLGFERTQVPHDTLRKPLQESYGVVVYHEQVMRAISAMTGVDLGTADKIRRKLSDDDEAPKIAAWFVETATKNGIERTTAERVWREVIGFAAFGFAKSHAAAFAVPTYQSAWLKANHPAAFYTGVLTHEPGMYPRRAILHDARIEGVPILPLDINTSDKEYTVQTAEDGTLGVRIGLMHVAGISDEEIDRIVRHRPYRGLVDLCRRAEPDRPTVEALIHAGALAFTGSRRRDLLLQVHDLWGKAKPKPEPAQTAMPVEEPLIDVGLRAYSDAEKVRAELEVTQMDFTRHVVSFYEPVLKALRTTRTRDLLKQRQASRVMVAGVKVASQTPAVKSGQRIIFLTLDDGHGLIETTVFESVQEQCAWTIFHSWLLVVRGTIRRTGARGISLNVERAWDLTAIAKEHQDGTLDLKELWTEGIEEIERYERERRAANRAKRAAGLEPPKLPHPTAIPLPLEPKPVHPRSSAAAAAAAHEPAGAPKKLWHSSGGSAGA
ncbi:MAG: DNA polymerase III subunit alpha [Actinobacteria bacterium]|nr:DNA polymerase III subunit alpha [Actinomycetota bacterium]